MTSHPPPSPTGHEGDPQNPGRRLAIGRILRGTGIALLLATALGLPTISKCGKEPDGTMDVMEEFPKELIEQFLDLHAKGKVKEYNALLRQSIAPRLQDAVGQLAGQYVIEVDMKAGTDVVKKANGMATEIKTAAQLSQEDGLPDEWFAKYLLAEAGRETGTKEAPGGRYEALGCEIGDAACKGTTKDSPHAGTRALGRYQIMPREWILWCMEHEGRVLRPTPAAMERIAYKQFLRHHEEFKRQYKTPWSLYWGMAAQWFGMGKAGKSDFFKIDNIPFSANPDTRNYADDIVMARMGLQPADWERAKQNLILTKNSPLEGGKQTLEDALRKLGIQVDF